MSNLNWKNDPRRSPVMTVTEVVAANVHRLRKRRGWTQDQLRQQLAETGVRLSRPTVVALEKGKRSIEVSELVALGLALGIAPHLLLYPPVGIEIIVADDREAPRYASATMADWLWDPDANELSTAGVSEGGEWFDLASMATRVSSEDLRALSRRVRDREREGEEPS